ncbi:MAG TPA: alpha/beta hydrolase fold domain-containing protein, partial [Thermodesulfobacteriota bacterium]|nr:alpha/beta hydrolase fold domain-containing protein [Thermodesulfobacteriota bacterium]
MVEDGMKNGRRAVTRTAMMIALISFVYMGVIGGCGGGSGGTVGGGNGGGAGAGINVKPGGTLAAEPETFSYVEGGTDRQTLDFYRINGISSPRPALVWFHGGGWVINSKENIEGMAFDIAEAGGFHLISVDYRLAGQDAEDWPG